MTHRAGLIVLGGVVAVIVGLGAMMLYVPSLMPPAIAAGIASTTPEPSPKLLPRKPCELLQRPPPPPPQPAGPTSRLAPPKPLVLPARRLCWLRHAEADRGLRCSGIAVTRSYRAAVAAMAAPAVQYHHQLIEQRTDPARPNSDYDGSRAIPCRPAAGDRHCGSNDNHPSGRHWPDHWRRMLRLDEVFHRLCDRAGDDLQRLPR